MWTVGSPCLGMSVLSWLWKRSRGERGVGAEGSRGKIEVDGQGGEVPRVIRRVVALVVERITPTQGAEAPAEIIDEGPREERLLPAGAYPLPPVHIVVHE